jgi:hypothetical protein
MVSFWIDPTLRFVTAVAATCVAFYVARISKRQWQTNQEKLRLDLYQRRFEIYLRVLEFHLALLEWQDEPKLAVLHRPFLKAFCESKFLFPQKSGIHDFLGEYNERAARVRAYKGRPDLSNEASPEERAQLAEDQKWMRNLIGTLDKKLSPYLNFDSI